MWPFNFKEKENKRKWECGLEDRVKRIEKELKQMKCLHPHILFKEIIYSDYDGILNSHSYCKECNKILEIFMTEQDFNSAKAKWLREQADELELV